MTITREHVLHVAKLSKLSPKEEELECLQHDLERILAAMNTMPQICTEEDADNRELLFCVPREDAVSPSCERSRLMINAPLQNGESIVVPKTVE